MSLDYSHLFPERNKEPVHWLVQLRRDLDNLEWERLRNTPSAKIKRWLRNTYYRLFPSMNPMNWVSVIPMKPPSSAPFYQDYSFKYTEKDNND